MMTPYRTRAAKKNLREGIKKMEKVMSPAAQVRRDFRLGRPLKEGEAQPLHPLVVWKRAMEALLRFRVNMTLAKLDPSHVTAVIVYIEEADQDKPNFLMLEEPGRSIEDCQKAVFEQLSRPDVIALGMLFRQWDEQKKQQITFPYQFMGLNDRGIAVLRRAAELQDKYGALTRDAN